MIQWLHTCITNSEWSRSQTTWRYLPGRTDKAIKMAGSTVETWRDWQSWQNSWYCG